jgi:hypothetical protein
MDELRIFVKRLGYYKIPKQERRSNPFYLIAIEVVPCLLLRSTSQKLLRRSFLTVFIRMICLKVILKKPYLLRI